MNELGGTITFRSMMIRFVSICYIFSFMFFFITNNTDFLSQIIDGRFDFVGSLILTFTIHIFLYFFTLKIFFSETRKKLADSAVIPAKFADKEQNFAKSQVLYVRKLLFPRLRNKFYTDVEGFRISKNIKITKSKAWEHFLLLGSTGTGKSSSVLIPAIFDLDNVSLIVTDPKGELHRKTKSNLISKGYEIIHLDFTNPRKSAKYSLLKSCTSHDDVRNLTSAIMGSGGSDANDDKTWSDLSKDLLLAFMLAEYDKGKKDISTVIQNMATVDPKDYDEFFSNKGDAAKFEYDQFQKTSGADSMISSIFKTIQSKLFGFRLDSVKEINSESTFTADDFRSREKKVALFISYPESKADVLSGYLAPFFEQLFDKIKTHASVDENLGRTDGRSVYFILDEFPNIGRISTIAKDLATIRSKRASVFLLAQSISQIKTVYKEDYNTIIENTKTKAIFSSTSAGETGDFFMSLMGEEEYKQTSYSSSQESKLSVSESIQKKATMTKDQLRRMKSYEIVIVTDNLKPIVDDKNYYYMSPIEYFIFKHFPFSVSTNKFISDKVVTLLTALKVFKPQNLTKKEQAEKNALQLNEKFLAVNQDFDEQTDVIEQVFDEQVEEAETEKNLERISRILKEKQEEEQFVRSIKKPDDSNVDVINHIGFVDVLSEDEIVYEEITEDVHETVEETEEEKKIVDERKKQILNSTLQKIDLDLDLDI